MTKRSNTKDFVLRAKEVHGNKYDYSCVQYVNTSTKIQIKCRIHGIFPQTPNQHLGKHGCPECGGSLKPSREQFIERAIRIHGDKYDYSEVNYVNARTNISITCRKHGIFEITPDHHLNRRLGCYECKKEEIAATTRPLREASFIERSEAIHRGKYDYSKVVYINNFTDVQIICPEHGPFPQRPANHIKGAGCPTCDLERKRKTTEEFIKDATKIHGDKYDYSKVDYITNIDEVEIVCPKHGSFFQKPTIHVNSGSNCPMCSPHAVMTKEEFIRASRKVHGDKFDYSSVKYNTARIKVTIICPLHGPFEQVPYSHLVGNGCGICAGNAKFTQSEFIKKARDKHGELYDYSLVEYANVDTNVKIICKEHGVFEQTPYSHLNSKIGCSRCVGNAQLDTSEFIERAIMKHGEKYDYSEAEYKGTDKKVKIICQKHGVFPQTPYKHLTGQGCPSCQESHGEAAIERILKDMNIDYEREFRIPECKNILPLPFDFGILRDSALLGLVEFDGIQHFVPSFGGKSFSKTMETDVIKNDYCESNGIPLLRIPYWEEENIKKLLAEFLEQVL
jgi:hypothetical protein